MKRHEINRWWLLVSFTFAALGLACSYVDVQRGPGSLWYGGMILFVCLAFGSFQMVRRL